MVETDHTEVVDIDHTAMLETTHYRGGREFKMENLEIIIENLQR